MIKYIELTFQHTNIVIMLYLWYAIDLRWDLSYKNVLMVLLGFITITCRRYGKWNEYINVGSYQGRFHSLTRVD